MAVLVAATSMSDFNMFSGSVNPELNTAILAPNVFEGVQIPYKNVNSNVSDLELNFPTNISSGSVSFYIKMEANGNNWSYDIFRLVSSDNVSSLRITIPLNSSDWVIYYSDASGLLSSNIGTPAYWGNLIRFDIDFVLANDSTGLFRISIDSVVIFEQTGPNIGSGSLINKLAFVRQGGSSSAVRAISGVIVADEPTYSMNMVQQVFSAAGSVNTWDVGTFDDINNGGIDIGSSISTTGVGDELLGTFSAIPVQHASDDIKYVSLAGYGLTDSLQIDAITKIGATTYNLGQFIEPNALKATHLPILTNPATALPWTISDLDSAEFGVKTA